MLVKKIIKVVLLLLAVLYIFLQSLALELEGSVLSAVILVLLTCLYVGWTKHKSKLFLGFLVFFSTAQILSIAAYFIPEVGLDQVDTMYFGINVIYIMAYTFLIIKIIRQFNLRKVFQQLTVPIIILVILDVFCVTLISGTTEGIFNYYEYVLEFTYNAVVMILLSLALIDYMYRNSNKSMLFLIGSIFIVFSEIIQLAYYYILPDDNLGFVYSLFFIVAFIFLYQQSQSKVTEPVKAYSDNPVEAYE